MIKLDNIKINTVSENYIRYPSAEAYWILRASAGFGPKYQHCYYMHNSTTNSEVLFSLF